MALTTEDGTGLADAESYASVSEADTYFSNLSNASWTGTDAVKEAALRKATTYLDAVYNWTGYIYSATQSLNWPRTSVYDKQGRNLAESVPTLVKQATFELALASLSADLLPSINNSNFAKREKVGELEIEYRDDAPTMKQYKFVDALLSGLYTSKTNSGSGVAIRA